MTVKLLSTSSHNGNGNGVAYPGKRITEIITNGFFKVDRRWTVKYWNKAAEKILGIAAKDILGKNIWEVFAERIPTEFYAVYHTAFLQDIPVRFEEYWAEMGSWFDVITYLSEDILAVSFKSYSQPAHSQHPDHPEQQLKALNELYRLVTEITNDCLWEWDLQNKEVFWIDGGHRRLFGYLIENALVPQAFWEDLLHPEDKERILRKLKETLSGDSGNCWEVEYRFKKTDGSYAYVHDCGHIFYDEKGLPVTMIGATQDITARKIAENELMEERVARQREITDAVLEAHEKERASIGKELHDNLNQILGAAKLYIELAKTDDESRGMCLEKSSGYIMKVIEEIRKISKTMAIPSPHLMGLIESINNLVDDLIVIHPVKIEFHEKGIVENMLDERLQLDIFRIVQEQLNNILKHSKATRATINLTGQGKEILLLISDNGEGYDTFQEVTGVGLINITSRAESYQGKVTVVSSPGEGYTLKVMLHNNNY
jgi:PAS domain S-box-containing protein